GRACTQRRRCRATAFGRLRRDRADRRSPLKTRSENMSAVRKLSGRLAMAGLGLVCGAAVLLALLAQHRYGMEPCPWCILQRMLFVLIAVGSLVAAALPGMGRRLLSIVLLPFALGGVAAALWQHFVAAKTNSCALTFADK